MRVDQVMQPEPITVPASMPFLEIQRLFVTAQIGAVPVVDDAGKVIGTVDTFDLLRAVDQVLDEDVDPGEAGGEDDFAERIGALTAASVLNPQPTWVQRDAPIAQVASLMRREGVHRVLVRETEGGALVGIATTFDLLRGLESG